MKSNDTTHVDLNKLRTFFAIAERGGVSAAAQQLALTRSAVSHSLASFEGALGMTLFHRVGKKLVLTREGALLRRAYADIEARIESALGELRDDGGQLQGSIRLGLFSGFSRFRLADALDHFLAENPAARVRVVYGSRAELIDALQGGRLDCALALDGGGPTPRIRSSRLFDQSLVLASKVRPKRARGDFESLTRLPIVDYFRSEPLIDRWVAHHFGRRRKIARSQVRVWVASNADLAVELCCKGVGACVLPQSLVEPFRKRKQLAIVNGPRAPLRDGIWLNELASVRRSRLQTAFRDALFERLR